MLAILLILLSCASLLCMVLCAFIGGSIKLDEMVYSESRCNQMTSAKSVQARWMCKGDNNIGVIVKHIG